MKFKNHLIESKDNIIPILNSHLETMGIPIRYNNIIINIINFRYIYINYRYLDYNIVYNNFSVIIQYSI